MRQRGLAMVSLLALVAAALSGCAAGDDSEPTSQTTTSATTTRPGGTVIGGTTSPPTTGTGTTSGTGTTGTQDRPPQIEFSASITNGQIPLNVSFTIKGTDPEGKAVSYSLNFGDSSPPAVNTSMPSGSTAVVDHQYTTGGEFNATLSVGDGKNVANAWLVINATAAAISSGFTYTCTAQLTERLGAGGSSVVVISGCTFIQIDRAMVLFTDDIPSGPGGCSASSDTNGDGVNDPTTDAPYELGTRYEPPTIFSMGCGPLEAESQGSITLIPG